MVESLVRRAFDMFNRRDLDGLLELLHPEVRVHSLMTEAEPEEAAHEALGLGSSKPRE